MRSQGTVIRAYGGFYYVLTESGSLTCKPRGRLRLVEDEILVGDRVEVSVVDSCTAIIEKVLDRATVLSRPKIANVDLAIVVVAARNPDPSTFLIDRYLALIAHSGLDAVLCINKVDLEGGMVSRLSELYLRAGYDVIATAAIYGQGVDELERRLAGRTSVLAGPSGVGKSALLKALCPDADVVLGDVSHKTRRGKHTTRFAQLVPLSGGGFVADTPGFSYLRLEQISADELRFLFPEFRVPMKACKFSSCLHREEPGCEVKAAVRDGRICNERYSNYLKLLDEIESDQR